MLVVEARYDPPSVASKAAKQHPNLKAKTGHHVSAVSLSSMSSLGTKLAREQFEIEDATMFQHTYASCFSKGTLMISVGYYL